MEEIPKWGDIHIHRVGSLCCTIETNIRLYSNCTSTKIIFETVLPIKRMWVDEMGLGMNTSKGWQLIYSCRNQKPAVVLTHSLHNVILWGDFPQLHIPGPHQLRFWILLVWGEVLAWVGSKSSQVESNRKPDLWSTITEENELSVGIVVSPTGKIEDILIDYIID